MALGRVYQLSDSCVYSTVDASQITDGPFDFWGRIVFLKHLFATLTWKHMRTAIYASVISIIMGGGQNTAMPHRPTSIGVIQ